MPPTEANEKEGSDLGITCPPDPGRRTAVPLHSLLKSY